MFVWGLEFRELGANFETCVLSLPPLSLYLATDEKTRIKATGQVQGNLQGRRIAKEDYEHTKSEHEEFVESMKSHVVATSTDDAAIVLFIRRWEEFSICI
jgi:hypothetical protein